MTLPLCACGKPAFAIRPGTPALRSDSPFDIIIEPGEPDRVWCREAWLRRFGPQQQGETHERLD